MNALSFALVGNPNCGKTTLFNALTGQKQVVGNWPGVTVEKKIGTVEANGGKFLLTDLPGTYSLYPYTEEEEITKAFIFSDSCRAILNIADAANLERNLYLTLQLLEVGKPVIVALNRCDILKRRGIEIDADKLSAALGVPVVPISARKGYGLDILKEAALNIRPGEKIGSFYRGKLADLLKDAESRFKAAKADYPRYRAVEFFDFAGCGGGFPELNNEVSEYAGTAGLARDAVIADAKYKYIISIIKHAQSGAERRKSRAAAFIDAVTTNKFLAAPLFLGVMFLIFMLAFGPPGQGLKAFFEGIYRRYIIDGAERLLVSAGVSKWLVSFLKDGILLGVGSVISFLPELAILFMCLSLLEDSGYMARTAFIADRLFKRLGLSGKSFIPMLMGFGCSVPAFMAARTMENEKERRLTLMMIPFMSCGARLPVYAVFCSAFFEGSAPLVIFLLYIAGIAAGLFSAVILKRIVLKGERAGFILELPEYGMPAFRNVKNQTFKRIKDFFLKAGTVITLSCAVIWFLQSFDMRFRLTDNPEASLLALLGGFFARLFSPLGFGDWRAAAALISGITAKEAVAGTLEILLKVSDNPAALYSVFTPASAVSFLTFTLLYTPCIAALAAEKREMRSDKWFAFATLFQLCAAWLGSFVVYNISRLFL